MNDEQKAVPSVTVALEGPYSKAVEETVKTANSFLERILGPAATEIGQLLADPVRNWRAKRAAKLVLAWKKSLEERDVREVKLIPPSVLVPALESASLETDESLQQRWTALLVSASDPSSGVNVTPAFPRILTDLSAREASMLDWLYRKGFYSDSIEQFHSVATLADLRRRFPDLNAPQFKVIASNLMRLGLSEPEHYTQMRLGGAKSVQVYHRLKLSPLGAEFVRACALPPAADLEERVEDTDPDRSTSEINPGDTLSVRCEACREPTLVAQDVFESRAEHLDQPDEPPKAFWSVDCVACGARFLFDAQNGELRRLSGDDK